MTSGTITMNSVLKPGSEQLDTEIDDKIVSMSVENGEYYVIDETGAIIWRLLDGDRDLEQICDELAQSYDAPRDDIAAAVIAFVETLATHGLVDRS